MILEPDIVTLGKVWSWFLPENGGFPWRFVDCFGWKGTLSSPILTLCITLSCRGYGIKPVTWAEPELVLQKGFQSSQDAEGYSEWQRTLCLPRYVVPLTASGFHRLARNCEAGREQGKLRECEAGEYF